MRRYLLLTTSAALACGIVCCATPLLAQTPSPAAPMSREERIRQHNEKIEKILEENRRRQAEEQAKRQAQQPTPAPGTSPAPGAPAPTPAAAPPVSGAPLPAGPVGTVTPAPQTQPAAPPADAGQPKGARSEARSLIYFRPFDSVVNVGDVFTMDLVADTRDGAVDEISALLEYPVRVLNVLAIDHSPIDPLVAGEMEYLNDPDKGLLYVRFPLASRQKMAGRSVARLYWEALAPTPSSSVQFATIDKLKTGLFYEGQNILGTPGGKTDGVINATVMVRDPNTKPLAQKLGDRGLIVSTTELKPPVPRIELELRAARDVVEMGKEFDVDVVLRNPSDDPLNHVQLLLQFDPETLQVLDTDRGNWIRQGTNILDGFAHDNFPFDFHRVNSADNQHGRIVYEMGREFDAIRSSGPLARIRFRTIRQVERTEIALMTGESGQVPTTDVKVNGISILANKPKNADAVAAAIITVTEAPGGN